MTGADDARPTEAQRRALRRLKEGDAILRSFGRRHRFQKAIGSPEIRATVVQRMMARGWIVFRPIGPHADVAELTPAGRIAAGLPAARRADRGAHPEDRPEERPVP